MFNKNTFILFYHILEAFLNLYMLYWNCIYDEALYLLQNFCYLTVLTHSLVCLYCLMALDYDFQYMKSKVYGLKTRYPSHIHTLFQLIQGLGAVVMLTYWGLRLFKPDLLFPEGYNWTPEVLAFYLHGGNFAVLAMELGLYENKVYLTRIGKFKSFCVIIVVYMAIQAFHRNVYGYHIYPFIEKLSYGDLLVFYGTLFTICVSWDFVFCGIFIKKKEGIC